MSHAESGAAMSICEGDAQAIALLFKRIAERGHRIRTQVKSTDTSNTSQSTPRKECDSKNQPAFSDRE